MARKSEKRVARHPITQRDQPSSAPRNDVSEDTPAAVTPPPLIEDADSNTDPQPEFSTPTAHPSSRANGEEYSLT